jgi:hypothetical protein
MRERTQRRKSRFFVYVSQSLSFRETAIGVVDAVKLIAIGRRSTQIARSPLVIAAQDLCHLSLFHKIYRLKKFKMSEIFLFGVESEGGVGLGFTSRFDRIAQSSSVSAASYFPWRRYSAPRFFSVVVTVGESTFAALCQPPYSP